MDKHKIKLRRGLKKDLPQLLEGEPGFCIDTKEFFIGSDIGNIPLAKLSDLTEYDDTELRNSLSTLDAKVDNLDLSGGLVTYNTIEDLENSYPEGTDFPVWVKSERAWYYWGIEDEDSHEPDPVAPSNITNLSYTNVTQTSANLSWTASTEAISYDVELDGVFLDNTTETSYAASNLTQNTQYTFTVKAKNDIGTASGVSIQLTTQAEQTTDPTAPNNVTNLQYSNVTQTSLTLSWSTSEGADSYDIERDGTFIENVSDTTYNVTGLVEDTQYTFTVKSISSEGISSGTSITVSTQATEQDDTQPVIYVDENRYLTMPANQLVFGFGSNERSEEADSVVSSHTQTPLFDTNVDTKGILRDQFPYVQTTNGYLRPVIGDEEGFTFGESGTLAQRLMVRFKKANVADPLSIPDIQAYIGKLKIKLAEDYQTFNVPSEVSNVTTRSNASAGYEYFKCTINTGGFATTRTSTIIQYCSTGAYVHPGYTWTHGSPAIRVNADNTLEMLVPEGTLESIDVAGVSKYLEETKVKIFYAGGA